MTILVDPEDSEGHSLSASPSSSKSSVPSYVDVPADNQHAYAKVLKAVIKAKRIAVVCGSCLSQFLCSLEKLKASSFSFPLLAGAGISCASGIPDFRSSEGLFKSLKENHPGAGLSSGKDLFDASVFKDEVCFTELFQLAPEF
jgi:hypothetical protein